METKKFKFKMPHNYVILISIMVLMLSQWAMHGQPGLQAEVSKPW